MNRAVGRVFAYFVKSVSECVLEDWAWYWCKLKTMKGPLLAVSIGSCWSGGAADEVGCWTLPPADVRRWSRCRAKHLDRTKPQEGSLAMLLLWEEVLEEIAGSLLRGPRCEYPDLWFQHGFLYELHHEHHHSYQLKPSRNSGVLLFQKFLICVYFKGDSKQR